MPLKKDLTTFYKKQPIAAIVIAVPFTIMALSAFTTGFATGKLLDWVFPETGGGSRLPMPQVPDPRTYAYYHAVRNRKA